MFLTKGKRVFFDERLNKPATVVHKLQVGTVRERCLAGPVDRLRGLRSGRELVEEGALDCGITGRCDDLRAEQIGDIEYVDGALAERRHMRRCNVEIEL